MAIYDPKELENYYYEKVKELIWAVDKCIDEYERIVRKNRKGDFEEGRYDGVKELGMAIRDLMDKHTL